MYSHNNRNTKQTRKKKKKEKTMDDANIPINPQEGPVNGGESLLPTTPGSSSTRYGGSSPVQEKRRNARRVERDSARCEEWRDAKKEKKRKKKEEEKRKREEEKMREKETKKAEELEAGPSQTSPISWTRKCWVRGSSLFRRRKKREGETDQEQALPAEREEAATPADPAAIYQGLEESCKLARIEEAGNLKIVLRHITRLKHPKGHKICYPAEEMHDRIQLRCANLPTDPDVLLSLLEKVFDRRGETLDLDSVYRDQVMYHGRSEFDGTRQYPSCYYQTRQP
jgi:hypothetical protein